MEELAELVKEKGAEKILFDNPLKSIQSYNLAKATGVEAIDRFQLILEIFTKRATTTEAQLQIQLATMRYELTHAKEKARLTKKGEQPGFMGLGAYEADVYSDAIKRQIQTIKTLQSAKVLHREGERNSALRSLASRIHKRRKNQFVQRFNDGNIACWQQDAVHHIIHYHAACGVFCNKEIPLNRHRRFHRPVTVEANRAFQSTLEETIYSDVIILVVDFSEPLEDIEKKNNVCLDTINRIGASGIPLITALNKIDLLSETEKTEKLEALRDKVKNPVLISALLRTNLDALKKEILKNFKKLVEASFIVPLTNQTMQFLSWVHNGANVKKTDYTNNSVQVVFEAAPAFVEGVRKKVEGLNGKFETCPAIHTVQQ